MLNWILGALVAMAALGSSRGEVIFDDAQADGSSGRLRYFYDNSIQSDACENLVLLGVGTTMRTSDYDELLSEMVTGNSIVAMMIDQNPLWFVKTNARRFASFTNAVVEQLSDIVPVCEGSPKRIVIGGHSAGGQAAWNSISMLTYKPAGFLGLDPFRLDPEDNSNLPALMWGFTQTSCQVTSSQAAKAGYQATNPENRVFYQVDNGRSDAGHCSFTDEGCFGPVCPARETSSAWVRESVAESTTIFLKAIADGIWDRNSFTLEADGDGTKANLFVNKDTVSSRRTRYLRG